jgi:hypothetical protein
MKTIVIGAMCLSAVACTNDNNLGNTYSLHSARWATSLRVTGEYGGVSAYLVGIDPSSGSVLAAGAFEGTVDFGAGPITTAYHQPTFWIGKRSGVDGSHLWTKLLGTLPNFELRGLRVDSSGNAIVAGGFSGTQPFGDQPLASLQPNIYVAKLLPDGHTAWVRDLDLAAMTEAHVDSLAVGADGRIYVSGLFRGAIHFPDVTAASTPDRPCFVAAFEPDGTLRWGRQFPVAGTLAVASDGSVIMVAAADRSMTFGGVSIDLTRDSSQFAARITADGDVSWVHGFGQPGVEYRSARLALDDQDRIATISYSAGTPFPTSSQTFLDANANPLWTAAPVSGTVMPVAIATNGHAVLTAGQIDRTVDLGSGPQIGSMYLAARNADGSLADSKVYGDPGVIGDQFSSLAMAQDGSVAFTGGIGEAIDFGSGPVAGPIETGLSEGAIVIGLFAPEM